MAQCPDCDGVKISIPNEGDGKCSVCHGLGGGGLLDEVADALAETHTECWACHDSGDCQTCGGSGVVEDDEDE